jgi:ATP-dependent RNA helicase DDX19/DBP5
VVPRLGRTGRFGRKGVSINFVHDKRTWDQVRAIEQALGKSIVRVSTDDLDVMEEVQYFQFFVGILH